MKPNTPQTLYELCKDSENTGVKLPLLTKAEVFMRFESRFEYHSLLKLALIADILVDATLSKQNQEKFNRLKNKVHFPSRNTFPEMTDKVARNTSIYGFIWDDTETKVVAGSQGIFAVVHHSI